MGDAYIHPSAVMDESTLEKDKYKDTHKVNANEQQTNQPINKNSYASSRKINHHEQFYYQAMEKRNISTKTATSASKKNFNQKKSHSSSIMCCHSSWFTYITTVTVQNNMLLSC